MLIKKSLTLNKHRTSLALEKEFWNGLELVSKNQSCSIQNLISKIDIKRKTPLASAIRVFLLEYFKNN